jgi:type I restriction-modification system DNA methylase subunit/predicted type IV restriction endonuclease
MLEKEEPPLGTGKDSTAITAPEEARSQVQDLVQRFARNLDAYTRPDYKEERVRVEFIDPFFEALGWDVRNVQGYAEPYKDVVHEDAIKISGATKAPDYCFRVGGTRKFFLEAKKPSVPVKGEVGPAYQLRRYAWSAKLPLSILTDFEEFAVYDCRQRPKPGDKASVGRVMYLTYEQYLHRLDEIYSIFARESVYKGSFDRYVEDTRAKRGTGEVDVEFLKEIEGWRDELARNIALRNPQLSVYELNFGVQRTIDRIIFLRMCEDRGIEGYARLRSLTSGPHIYQSMGELYQQADEKYNSDLFDFKEDQLTRSMEIDDRTLKPILSGLYYPDSPYEFSVLPPEILGQVYEQFLGKVIRLTPGHRAKVEEKPEVKKAGGVYYTPAYIVEYIVEQTVGRLIEGKTPQQISKLRILDPACGSGSFLLGAYQRLLDYHRQWYEEHDPQELAKAKRPPIYQGRGGEWRLTTGEKKCILLNNIYGVDIDRQAVEVTKLSLLLRVLEGENEETLTQQFTIWRERALPDLGENVKCGNSLIGPDYFEGRLMRDEEELRRVNPFDWEREFPEIMEAGGFDGVIGNPPYVFGEYLDAQAKSYLKDHYDCAIGQYDTYWLFAERGTSLTSRTGSFSMIVPDALLARDEAAVVRRLLLSNGLASLYHCGQVFSGTGVSALVYALCKAQPATAKVQVFVPSNHEAKLLQECDPRQFAEDRLARFTMYLTDHERNIIRRIQDKAVTLGNLAAISRGEESGKKNLQPQGTIPIIVGEDVARYHISQPSRYIGAVSKAGVNYRGPKMVMVKTGRSVVAAIEPEGLVTLQSLYNIQAKSTTPMRLEYILGHLNSTLVTFYARKHFTSYKRLFPQFNQTTVEQLPIRTINFDDPEDVARHDKMVALVERMLDLHKKLHAATIPADKKLYQRRIEATDAQIDALVYELYGLTQEEIAIVEGRKH